MVEKSHPLLKLSQFQGVDIKPRNNFFQLETATTNFKTMYIFQKKIRITHKSYLQTLHKISKKSFNSSDISIIQKICIFLLCDGIWNYEHAKVLKVLIFLRKIWYVQFNHSSQRIYHYLTYTWQFLSRNGLQYLFREWLVHT